MATPRRQSPPSPKEPARAGDKASRTIRFYTAKQRLKREREASDHSTSLFGPIQPFRGRFSDLQLAIPDLRFSIYVPRPIAERRLLRLAVSALQTSIYVGRVRQSPVSRFDN